jgi:hypothetical protein
MQAAGARRRNIQEQNEAALVQSQQPVTQNMRSRVLRAGRGRAGSGHPPSTGPLLTAPVVPVDSNRDRLDSPPEQGEEVAVGDSAPPEPAPGDNVAMEVELQEENEVEDDLSMY